MIRLTRRQSREVDRIAIEDYGIPSIVLMENAARSAAAAIETFHENYEHSLRSAVILCGPGNNGGDGFAIARHLLIAKFSVSIILCCNPHDLTGDALINFRTTSRLDLPTGWLDNQSGWPKVDQRSIIVDAIYGTGFRPPSRLDLQALRNLVVSRKAPIVSIDLPSGMDADTGDVDAQNCFQADLTVTFAAEKAGFANSSAGHYTGNVVVADIGVPRAIILKAAASPA